MPYVPDDAGTLLVGVGAAAEADASFPLAGLQGDLLRVPVALSYSFAPGAVLYLRGDALRRLEVERRGPSPVELDPGVDDGTTSGAGDVRIGTLVRLAGRADGLSAGLHLDVTVPSSDERSGVGTNTTDLAISAFGSWGGGPWRASADLGVGILEAPVADFVQNDVVVYAAEVTWRRPDASYRLGLSASGRASTRGSVPLGTEDSGRVAGSVEWLRGPWRADGAVAVGVAGTSADWSLEVGLARVFGR